MGYPGDEVGEPDVGYDAGDGAVFVGGGGGGVHGVGEHSVHEFADGVDFGGGGGVGEHEGAGHGLREVRVALHGAGDAGEDEQDPVVGGVAGDRRAVEAVLATFELAGRSQAIVATSL